MAFYKTQVCESSGEAEKQAGDDKGHQLIEGMVKKLMQCDETELLSVVRRFRRLVSRHIHHNADMMVQAGCLPKFVELLHRDDNWQLQTESAWILYNVTGKGENQSRAVVAAGALPGLVLLLSSTQANTRLFAAWTLRNICGHDPGSRDLVLDHNAIPRLLPLLKEETELIVRTTAWTLRNLCRVRPSPPAFSKLAPCVPVLADLVFHSDRKVGSYAYQALADLGVTYGSLLLTNLTPAFISSLDKMDYTFLSQAALHKLVQVVGNLEPAIDAPTQELESQGEQESNSASTDEQENSSTSTGEQENSSTSTGEQENSSTSTKEQENSSTSTKEQENSSTSTKEQENSSTSTKEQENSSTSTKEQENSSTSTGEQENSSTSTGEQENSSAGSASKNGTKRQTTTKRSSVSPTSLVVSTRSTPKRLRVSGPTTSYKSWPRTRGRARRPLLGAPGHISTHNPQNKVELWSAIEAGDVEQVAQLVKEIGPNLTRGSSGCTLLHVAAANNQPEVVEWLLQLLSPNLVNKAGLTPAHLAAMKGHTQVLRLLLDDPHLDHLARDPDGNTYRHWLVQPLFEAVLEGDGERTRSLLRVGADPDVDGGRKVGGALVRELQVTTARHLATTLHHQHILKLFDKIQSTKDKTYNQTNQVMAFGNIPLEPVSYHVRSGSRDHDAYGENGAYVTILSYDSFPGQPHLDLPSSHTGAQNLASVFTKMGYSGHIHKDLTEQQTRQVLAQVRDMEELDRIGCAIFVVASHGTPHQHFLTSDGHLLDTRWLCNLFKDSQCPRLKNKPKLFIFDLCCGYYRQQGEEKKGRGQDTRVEEPLRDTVSLL